MKDIEEKSNELSKDIIKKSFIRNQKRKLEKTQ